MRPTSNIRKQQRRGLELTLPLNARITSKGALVLSNGRKYALLDQDEESTELWVTLSDRGSDDEAQVWSVDAVSWPDTLRRVKEFLG